MTHWLSRYQATWLRADITAGLTAAAVVIPNIEYTALMMLLEAKRKERERGVSLWLAALNPGFAQVVDRSPLVPLLGPGRRFHNLRQALEAFEQANAEPEGTKQA